MVALPRFFPRPPLTASPLVPPIGGAVAGLSVAALFALVPVATLEDWVWTSGVPSLIAAAEPPLGTTARAVLAIAGGGMAASVTWSLLYLLLGPGGLLAPRTPANAVPVVRRADAHRDAPPPRLMTAAELGTPLMEVAAPIPFVSSDRDVEQAVPVDLDQPLSAFDPHAIPAMPLAPPAPVAPLARQPIVAAAAPAPLARGERLDTFVLVPPRTALVPVSSGNAGTVPPPATATERPSIDVLLRRLEEVAARRVALGRSDRQPA